MELLKVYAALLRRKWLFLQAVLFFTIGAGILAYILPKRYEAVSKISVDSSDASLSILGEMDLGEMASSLSSSSDDMETKIALFQMRPILDDVIWRLQLKDTDGETLPAEKLLVPGIDGEILAQPYIAIEQQQGTDILLVTATANFPELAQILADTMAEVYLARSTEGAKKEMHDAVTFIQAELANIQVQFDQALRDVATAQEQEQVIDLDSELKAAVSRVSALLAERQGVDVELAELRAQVRERGRQGEQETADRISPATATVNSKVRSLQEAMVTLQLQREEELQDKTVKHPDIINIDGQIRTLQTQLLKALDEQHEMDPAVQTAEVQIAGLQKRAVEIDMAVADTVTQFGAYPDKMRKISQLQLAAAATEAVYQSLLEQQYEIEVAEAMTVSDMKFVEPAKLPDIPAAPKLLVYLVLGCFVGMGVGIGLVFLVEYIDDSVKSQEDLKLVWPVPVLGLIPHFKVKNGTNIADLPATDPIFEAYRNVRNGISFASVDAPINILTVTSSAPGEGKSTFVTNLAICLAQDGQRVVVVDCDLRRPTQHKAFNTLSNEVGVSNVLSQSAGLAEALQSTPVPNLAVLTSGPLPTNPGRLVESLRLRQLLHELAKDFDMVLVDAPPVLAVGDALSLGRATKGTVVVVESGKTTRRMLTDLRARFEGSGLEPTGVVFNKVDLRSSGAYGYYGHYAQHYAQGTKAKSKVKGIK